MVNSNFLVALISHYVQKYSVNVKCTDIQEPITLFTSLICSFLQVAHFYNSIHQQMIESQKPMMLQSALAFEQLIKVKEFPSLYLEFQWYLHILWCFFCVFTALFKYSIPIQATPSISLAFVEISRPFFLKSWITVSSTLTSFNTLWCENGWRIITFPQTLLGKKMSPEKALQKLLETCSWEPFCKTEYICFWR